jgi:hypothetical protein
MQNRILITSLVLFLFSVLVIAQEGPRDWSKAATNFNNPGVVHSPAGDGVLAVESFEDATFPPPGWIKLNPDGGSGWDRQTVGTSPIPGWNGGTITAPTGGGNAVAFCTWNTGGTTANDQWLVTPQITNVQPNDSLIFWMLIPGYTSAYSENVDILISTTGTNPSNFTIPVALLTFPANNIDTLWKRYAYKLGDFVTAGSNIYVGFREHVADNFNEGAAVLLDLVQVKEGAGSSVVFFDNFDTYTAGTDTLACQAPVWTTWSNAACGSEDADVSTLFAYSGTKSAFIKPNDDLVKDFGTAFSSGIYKISFRVFINSGKAGYFNTLATFAGSSSAWGLEVYFDVGGGGRANPNGSVPATFTWTPGVWNLVEHYVDLDADLSYFYFNGVLVHQQTWTVGAYTSTIPKTLDANDFYGATSQDNMYFDDYKVEQVSAVPVELTSFTASVTNNGQVLLNWTTATEVNNHRFEIERKAENSGFVTIGYVEGAGTTTEAQEYSFLDVSVQPGVYTYRLKQVDLNGTFEFSNEILVDVHPPLKFALEQNYPNPFNPATTIRFSTVEPSIIKLSVYNALGEEVAVLKNEFLQAGFYEVQFDASTFASGVYYYRLQSGSMVEVKKMILTK